jgi:hypothetical protein
VKRALLALVALAAACSSDAGTVARPGTLTIRLTAAGPTDGAVVIVVSGGPVTSVDAPSQYQVASNADGSGTHLMVVGDIAVGALATITIPDLSRASSYVAVISQVADRASFGLLDPARDQATIGP